MGEMATVEETRNYHIERTYQEFFKFGGKRMISTWLCCQIVHADQSKLLKPIPKRPIRRGTVYVTLPVEQLIEDLQMKIHRSCGDSKKSPFVNLIMVLHDVKRDLNVIKQEFLVYDQRRTNDLDGAFLEGFNEGSLQTRDSIKNFTVY